MNYSRTAIPLIFKGVSHDDLKWTINYLLSLLELPEDKVDLPSQEIHEEKYSARINKLLSIPKREITSEEINDDVRLQMILER